MDEETKHLLQENLVLAKENNKALKEILLYQQWSRWLGVIKWIIIIGSALGALYYLQPILENLWHTYNGLVGTVSDISVKTLPSQ